MAVGLWGRVKTACLPEFLKQGYGNRGSSAFTIPITMFSFCIILVKNVDIFQHADCAWHGKDEVDMSMGKKGKEIEG